MANTFCWIGLIFVILCGCSRYNSQEKPPPHPNEVDASCKTGCTQDGCGDGSVYEISDLGECKDGLFYASAKTLCYDRDDTITYGWICSDGQSQEFDACLYRIPKNTASCDCDRYDCQ